MELKITKKNARPFKGKEGDMIPYFWYTGVNKDHEEIEFGSTSGDFEVGKTTPDIELVKAPGADGKLRWKHRHA